MLDLEIHWAFPLPSTGSPVPFRRRSVPRNPCHWIWSVVPKGLSCIERPYSVFSKTRRDPNVRQQVGCQRECSVLLHEITYLKSTKDQAGGSATHVPVEHVACIDHEIYKISTLLAAFHIEIWHSDQIKNIYAHALLILGPKWAGEGSKLGNDALSKTIKRKQNKNNSNNNNKNAKQNCWSNKIGHLKQQVTQVGGR